MPRPHSTGEFIYHIAVLSLLATATFASVTGLVLNLLDDTPAATIIEEDDPRWDCRTMGNQVCGPQLPTLTP
jgi:hypothetical protein